MPSKGKVPAGYRTVTGGAAARGDMAWSEATQSFLPVRSFVGTPARQFWCLIRRQGTDRPWQNLGR